MRVPARNGVHKLIAKSHRWQMTYLAVASAALCVLWGFDAAALSLGRVTVQSALGEPLRAEIEVPNINAEEAASLKTSIALPEAFRAAGLEYSPVMSSLQTTLQKHSDGRTYIRLSGDRAVNDPFVDMIIEVTWASGHVVRDYTLLFDPPGLRQTAATAPTPAQVPAQTRISKPVGETNVPAPTTPVPAAAMTRPVAPGPGAIRPLTQNPAGKEAPGNTAQITVRPGDTASKIVAAAKPASVSLDQMLVALLRVNPNAFMHANVNRIKAGAIVSLPTEEQARTTPATQASEIIIAQSKDFNSFRNKLAGSALSTQVETADRAVSGNVQARVEDKKQLATAPDKLTLSKGIIQGKSAESQLAQERNTKEAASRAAEIAQNISDLSKIGAASNVAAPGLPASATTPTPAASQSASAPKPVAAAVAKRPVSAAPPQVKPSLVDAMLENPLLPGAAIGLIALLAAWGFYRIRQRNRASQVDSAFLESRLHADSFFRASGGESVDTNESPATGSSVMDSPSQLNAADQVDPVAEADVYLAYGRDLQAEEILKDALHANPGRISIYHKLLDLFAKRRDVKAFESVAMQALKVTHGDGLDWERFRQLGLSIDPDNALYQGGDQANQPDVSPLPTAPTDHSNGLASSADTLATAPQTSEALAPPASHSVDLDLDLNLDFSLDEKPDKTVSQPLGSQAQTAVSGQTDNLTSPTPNPDLELTSQAPAPLDTAPPAPAAPNSGMLEFDLGSLSLDLDDKPATDVTHPDENPLETKLALAREFLAIGDDHGARILLEEVISEASGDLKIKAQDALKSLTVK